ncbi:twin-arginine translocase TatA/TatE family subunit, partial [Vibrio cholerae]|uniref:twin-arginine translocase TatA/TatE family subunit n=1 Tax=Vibrio cholerae TaxID=666 RepID=UPI00159FFE92
MEWVILLVVALLLFGGSRLAGMGKGAGRAIREFKEETKGLKDGKAEKPEEIPLAPQSVQDPQTATQQAP